MINYDGLYDKNYFGDKLFKKHFSGKKLGFQIVENGIVLPHFFNKSMSGFGIGGVVDAERNFIDRTFVDGKCEYAPKKVEESSETVIYFGMLLHVWGHCLTDNLKRVWFLKSKIFQENFKNCPVVYVSVFKGIIPNFEKLLNILEIKVENLREIKLPTKFKKIILPDGAFWLEKGESKISDNNPEENNFSFFTEEYFETIERIRNFAKKNFTPLSQKKFYFFYGFNQGGEDRLANYFETKNYEIIRPEKFSFEEQLNILTNCENFASVTGSISHNIIFMRDNTQAILIPRRPAFLNMYQQALDQLHDMEIFYIDSALSIYAKNQLGPFFYIISEQLRKFFGDEITKKFAEEDFLGFIYYSKYARQEEFKINPQEEKYLGNMLSDFMQTMKQNLKFLEN